MTTNLGNVLARADATAESVAVVTEVGELGPDELAVLDEPLRLVQLRFRVQFLCGKRKRVSSSVSRSAEDSAAN